MLQKYPNLVETENVSHMVQKFKDSMLEVMSEDFDIPKTSKEVTSGDQIRSLLSRVNKKEKKEVVKIARKNNLQSQLKKTLVQKAWTNQRSSNQL